MKKPLITVLALATLLMSCSSKQAKEQSNTKGIESIVERKETPSTKQKIDPNQVEMTKTVVNGKTTYTPVLKEGAFMIGHLMFNSDNTHYELEQADRETSFLKTDSGIEIQVTSATDETRLTIRLNESLNDDGILNAKEYVMNKEQTDVSMSFVIFRDGQPKAFRLKEGSLMIDMIDKNAGIVLGHFHGKGLWDNPEEKNIDQEVNCDFDLHFNEF